MRVRGWLRILYSAWAPLAVVLVSACGDQTVAPPPPPPGLSIQLAPTNSGDQQTGMVATTLPNPLRVLVRRGSAAAPGITVRWTVVGGTLGTQGSLSATSTTTDATGIASVSWSLGQVAGQQRAMASISDPALSADSSAAFTAIANPGPASQLRFSVKPTNTFSGRPITPAVQVSVVDAFNNPTGSAATVTVALGAHSGTGVLSGTTRVDAAGGVAAFADLSIDQAGAGYSLGASATGLTGATSSAFDVVTLGTGQIAFVSTRDGNSEIYVMNEDGSGQVNLTNNPGSDDSPAWSPDGTRIAFQSDRDVNAEIYVMNADGSGLQNLTNNPSSDQMLAWSLDSRRIAFQSDRDGNREIYVMNADGSSLQKLTNNSAFYGVPVLSPDFTRIAFSSDVGHPEIYVMNADGSGLQQVTSNGGGGFDYAPAWSPDGTRIAFLTSGVCGNGAISVMNADGSGVTQLAATLCPTSDYYVSPVWRPDGSQIAWVFIKRCGIRCPPRRVVQVQNLSLTFTGADYAPAWSPDGTRIAFVSGRDGNSEIYVMTADGSGQINLTNNPGGDGAPAWRPR